VCRKSLLAAYRPVSNSAAGVAMRAVRTINGLFAAGNRRMSREFGG